MKAHFIIRTSRFTTWHYNTPHFTNPHFTMWCFTTSHLRLLNAKFCILFPVSSHFATVTRQTLLCLTSSRSHFVMVTPCSVNFFEVSFWHGLILLPSHSIFCPVTVCHCHTWSPPHSVIITLSHCHTLSRSRYCPSHDFLLVTIFSLSWLSPGPHWILLDKQEFRWIPVNSGKLNSGNSEFQ